MGQGMIHKLIDIFLNTSKAMGAKCDCADMEGMAIMVHRVMSYQSRQFHTLEHVFGFLEGADAETALAAVFHDLIYFQVDAGLPPEVAPLLDRYLVDAGGALRLAADIPESDRTFHICLAIFGFQAGNALKPFGGLNEFLSALVMMKALENHLPRRESIAIATCVEASIPFRGLNAAGRSVGEVLEGRLEALRRSGDLEAGQSEVLAMVHRAIAFGNKDVRDFSVDDPGQFLTNTWKLLPESNAALRSKGTFSIREYRVALEKMQGFFRSLAPETVYHSYRGLPVSEESARLEEAARRNIAYALAYMRAKLLAVGLLEAVALVSGGDAPMAMFMGDLPADGSEQESLINYLPKVDAPPWLDTSNSVYRLLKDGRLDESSFDLKNSPFALYLYHRLEPSVWGARSKEAEKFFVGSITAAEFLSKFETTFLGEIFGACASMLPTRRATLEDWLQART
jgi:hypothetical protein